jgi:dermatan 4-sulfotransferase 1
MLKAPPPGKDRMQAAPHTREAVTGLIGTPAQAMEALRRLLWGREHYIAFRDHPIVYGRVPKAANSTIKVMLARLLDGQRRGVSPDNFWKFETGGRTSMLRTRDAARLADERLVFTFVRNPADRLASFYDNKVRDANATLPMAAQKMGITKEDSLARVVDIVCDTPPDRMDVHVLPQSDILVHRGRLVPGFVGRYETFADDWEALRQRIIGRFGLDLGEFRKKPTHRIRTRSIEDYYGDAKLLEKVRRRYEQDFRLFYPEEL